jgi:hypothetical protein
VARFSTRFVVAALTALAWFTVAAWPAGAVVLPAHISVSFGALSIPKGGATTLSFSISNPNPGGGLTNIGFTDTLPSGLSFNVAGTNDCGGTLSETSSTLTLSGVALGGAALCVVSDFEVIGTTAGMKTDSVTVMSSAGSGNTATADLTVVAPPEVSTFFTDASGGGSPDWIHLGDTATVDVGVTNSNTASSLSGVGLSDTLPSGLVVANPNGLVTGGGCGPGTVVAVPGSHTIGLSGVTLAAGPSDPNSVCAVVVAVTGTQNGLQTNTTGIVSSTNGGSAAPTTASIGVFGPGPRVYWGATLSGAASGLIQFARADGSVAATVGTHVGSGGVEGTAIDAAAGRIYWMDAANSRISWSTLDDSAHGTVYAAGANITAPEGMAIDPLAGLLYWANAGGTHPISFAQLDGGGGGNLGVAGATAGVAAGPAIDAAQQRIYWANPSGNTISYANLDGSGGGDLVTSGATVNGPTGVTIDAAAGRVYWANENADKISYANLDGSGGADLDTTGATVTAPFGVAVDPATGRVYWANQTSVGSISYAGPGGNGTLTTPGLTPTAPAFPSLLFPPQLDGAVTVTGGSKPGAKLTCAASWAPDLLGSFLYRVPQTTSYQWQLNGADIAGAHAATFTTAANGTYACQVTGTNEAGTAQQASAGHQVATLSAVKLTSPSALFQLASRVVVSYSAHDSVGVSAVTYDVQYQRAAWDGGFGSWTSLLSGSRKTSATINGAPGHEYCARARAHDAAGNVSAWNTGCVVIPLDDRALSLATRHWTRATSAGSYHGTLTTTSTQGAKLRLSGAHVDNIALVVTKCPTCGKVGIYLGGTLWDVVDTHAATTRKEVLVVIGQFAGRVTEIVLRAMNAGRHVLIDGLGIART